MKKNFNIRNFIIVILCVTIIFMGVGFAFLASKLDASTNKQDKFDVTITKVEALTAIKGGDIDPSAEKELLDEGKTIQFTFSLNSPQDELAYEITIKNTGDIPARVIKLISSQDYSSDNMKKELANPVAITQTPIKNKLLLPDETLTVKLLVTYNANNHTGPQIIPYQLTVLATSNN